MLIEKSKMEEDLELLIDRATDQTKNHDTSDHFVAVWDRINKETDGPQVALRYLVQKVRSVNERESLCALELIEACVKNCGSRFHQEIGKFKFLNELVKMLSTKYDGGWTPQSVKTRIIELLYGWTKGLPRETKVLEAYKMLKTQGLITSDPVDPYKPVYSKEMQHPKNTVFDDEEKSKLLARLLKSKHPEDLQAANRLIKTMVRQDEIKTEKKAKRNMDIEQSVNNARLLTEMLSHYQSSSPSQDKELMKELFSSCEKMRPSLFRLASAATEEGDEGLAEILRANDELTKAIDEYKRKIGKDDVVEKPASPTPTPDSSAASAATPAPTDTSASSLIDLGQHQENNGEVDTNSSVLDDELKALGIHDTPKTVASQPTSTAVSNIAALSWGTSPPSQSYGAQTQAGANNIGMVRPMGYPGPLLPGTMNPASLPVQQFTRAPLISPPYGMPPGMGITPGGPGIPRPGGVPIPGMSPMRMPGAPMSGPAQPRGPPPANKRGPEALKKPASSLDVLGLDILQDQKQKQKQSTSPLPPSTSSTSNTTDQTLLSLASAPTDVNQSKQSETPWQQNKPATNDSSNTDTLLSLGTDPGTDLLATPLTRVSTEPEPLDNVFIPLDSVLPGDHQPLTALDKNGLKMVFHFAKTTAKLSRTDVAIVVISIMSTRSTAISNFVLQAAVPRAMKVKLQPPSGTELPAHNPILPAAAITQVMLIANPNKETIRLKYRATYETDGTTSVEAGEVTSFPPL